MDFTLSGEQLLIKDAARRFATQPSRPRDAWPEFAKLGWLALGTPEELGGFGGALERMLVAEELGRGLVLEPYATCAVFPAAILRAAGRLDLLEQLVEGESFAVAFEEPHGHDDPADIVTRADATSGGYVLRGRKARISARAGPATFIVSARLGDGVALFAVPSQAAGLQREDRATEDGTNAVSLELGGVAVGEDAQLAASDGLALLGEGIDTCIGALCGEAVGLMSTMFEMTLEYLKVRQQFGVPIGSFQALQHRMADMFVELELARSMAYLAAMTLDERTAPVKRSRSVSGAKVQIARSGRFVGQNAIQLHGAIGMTDEYRLGGYFKRMTCIQRLLGDADYHLARYAALPAQRAEEHRVAAGAGAK